ncbi:MAG: hypothetical protein AAF773_05350, partial [Cyanobacteria bacterium P01_D01_bin.115]
ISQHGSQIGWLIDPDEQTVLVYLPPDQVKIFDQPTHYLPRPLPPIFTSPLKNYLAGSLFSGPRVSAIAFSSDSAISFS